MAFKEKQYKEAMGDRYPTHPQSTERSEKLEEERALTQEKREAIMELRNKLAADNDMPKTKSGYKGPLRASPGPMPDLPTVNITINQAFTKMGRLIVKAQITHADETNQITINVPEKYADDKDALLAYLKEQYFLLKSNNSTNTHTEIDELIGENEL